MYELAVSARTAVETDHWLLLGQLAVHLIDLTNLLHCLWPHGERFVSLGEERVNGLQVGGDGVTQWAEQCVKQLLDVIINKRLDRKGVDKDAVHFDGARCEYYYVHA